MTRFRWPTSASCRVGCDLVEVSPPCDPSGNPALIAANLLYEMLCVLPKSVKAQG